MILNRSPSRSLDSFRWLYRHIPYASHISSYPQQLVVELEQSDDKEFYIRLQKLPPRIGSLNVGYLNEKIWRDYQVSPNPRVFDSQYDDTNHLLPEHGGSLYPGIVVECIGNHLDSGAVAGDAVSNSGVKIKKGEVERFTVEFHGWDSVTEKDVYHGGVKVGRIDETVSEDIGLVESFYPFSNELLDIDATAKQLLYSTLIKYGGYIMIDSAFTSRQTMRCR